VTVLRKGRTIVFFPALLRSIPFHTTVALDSTRRVPVTFDLGRFLVRLSLSAESVNSRQISQQYFRDITVVEENSTSVLQW